MTSLAGLPLFDVPSEPETETGWEAKASGRCAGLRSLLSDSRWHSMDELRNVAGWRYGARLLEVRRGHDGGRPVEVEKERRGDVFWYRLVPREVGP